MAMEDRFARIRADNTAQREKVEGILNDYENAVKNNDSKGALDARTSLNSAGYLYGMGVKEFNKRLSSIDSQYQKQFGVDSGTIKYNSQKGEADIEKGGAPASSESQGGGTFLTAGAVMDGNTMLTRGAAKKKTLLGGD